MIGGPLGPFLVALGVRAGLTVAVRLVDGVTGAITRGTTGAAPGAGSQAAAAPRFATALDAARSSRQPVASPEAPVALAGIRELGLEERVRAVVLDTESRGAAPATRRRETDRALAAYRRFQPAASA